MTRALLALALVGCVEHVQLSPGDGPLAGLTAIDLAPPQTTLAFTGLGAPPQALDLVATGHFSDGSERDVTAALTWTTDNAAPGTFVAPGHYVASGAAGGHVSIHATDGARDASATLTVTLTVSIVDGVYPPPGDPATLFPPDATVVTGDMAHAPAIEYPTDHTLLPPDLAPLTIQCDPGGSDAFRIAFDSDVLHVAVYTGTNRWHPDDALWSAIARSSPDTDVALAITATSSTATAPAPIYGSAAPTDLRFARANAGGALTFFSDSTNGVMVAELSATTAAKLYPGPADGTCAGCHTLARDGSVLAIGYGGTALETVDVATGTTIVSASAAIPPGWSAFSPAGDRLVVASNGALSLYDAHSGAHLGDIATGMPATHPDWSPDGHYVAVALAHMAMDMNMDGGAIARIPVTGDAFGAPEILVPSSDNNDNNFFPRYSPDGHWLAYVHATSASHAAATAELRLVPADGGTPIALAVASHRAGADPMPQAALADTMPSWAPAIDGDTAWLAFASARPYGVIRPMPMPSQIWIAGVDLAAAAAGSDPSFAAFWLPSQTPSAFATNPIWTAGVQSIGR
ncbi:MAG TPA: hypothetical protein VGM88_33205 [Kofleriaceae bacterium]|jgi:hypothetical protein